ncbi:MAG: hypothetical protein J6M25_01150 [Prevotella sp.]|nr:hypothetical protein [Prevotella sp.]
MKQIHLLLIALVCGLFTACMDGDWDEPSFKEGAPFGNNELTEEGLITIADLISRYPNVFASSDQNALITEPIKIKGRVTGNDLGGNIYKQFTLQDETAAIVIAVNQNGLNGYMAEGQELLVDLQGLYIGGYRKQPEIGAPYNGTSIGRMSKDVWATHFKLLDSIDPDAVKPAEFDEAFRKDIDGNCAKLVVLRNITFKNANGRTAFAGKNATTSGGNYVNQEITGLPSTVVVRTSTYADFAAMPLPYDTVGKRALPCTITGIATRYNSTWQIMIRKTSDIQIEK